MRIQTSTLLSGADKEIEFYNSALIVKDGPNMCGKMALGDVQINYDSFFTSKMTLASDSKDFPIMYGFLGTDITFIMIKVIYGGDLANPQSCCSDEEKHLEYFFEDQPLIRRYITDFMLLTGDDTHRIPQIYLYNPTNYDVTVEILVANVDPNTITSSVVGTYSEVRGLAFNDILSDQIFGVSCTGSTQYEILDIDGNIQMVIPYSKIDIVTIDGDTITIVTKSDDPVKLVFISEFNASQALSRMNWVRESTGSRYLTKTNIGYDTTGPTITFNPLGDPTIMSGYTSITKSDIVFRYIDTIIDYDDDSVIRDGIINNNDVTLNIMKNTSGDILSAITLDGYYTLTFSISDLAGNTTNSSQQLLKDGTPPTIYYNSGITGIMDLTGDTQTPGTIEKDDINRYFIDYVWDIVDGVVPNGDIDITINPGDLTDITVTGGTYTVDFSVSDTAGNTTIDQKTLQII